MRTQILHQDISWQNRTAEEALLAHQQGQFKKAYETYHYILSINSRHPQSLHYLGLMAQQNKKSKVAINLIRKSIKLLPTDVRAYNHLAQIYLSIGDISEALILLKKGIEIYPTHIDTLNSLANVLVDKKDVHAAIAIYRNIIKLDPEASHSLFNLAQALKEIGQYSEALEYYLAVVSIDSSHSNAYHGAGITSEELGQFDSAVKYYNLSLANSPSHIRSMANLLAIKSFVPSESLINQAKNMFKFNQLSAEEAAKLHNGLGKYFDGKGHYEIAFKHFNKSCDIQKTISGVYDPSYAKNFCEKIISAYSRPFFEKLKNYGQSDLAPIFIVGMPRSGTTLAEQIIASHPDVFGAGELTVIPKMSKQFLGKNHNILTNLTAEVLTQAADQYLSAMKQAGHGEQIMFSDKLPMNFMYLGFITAVFPNAKIIYCKRQPLDIGLSCYIEMFNLTSDFSINLNDFSDYFLDHHRIMQHWKKVLPNDIFELKYEDMVNNQEQVTRSLLSFVGLKWDKNCLNYYSTKRVVNTPSRWQVRQPIYSTSQERWKNYQIQLKPLIDALRKASFHYE